LLKSGSVHIVGIESQPAHGVFCSRYRQLFIASFSFTLEEFPQNLSSGTGKEPQAIYYCSQTFYANPREFAGLPGPCFRRKDVQSEGIHFAHNSILKDPCPESDICPWE
jgi:hypothetical protein